ncbi:hypothetical protein EDC03_0429 [Pseudokineococcus lusitanus]|uniref:DUF3097 family protein n=2 Tax=Pseudokineococcus lusitanus TaxID=763993 RepID=A0A3N1HTS8_9ACTN|nr:hypothetical protein EDC03_0429 [Pseudokineococcus lusitanus]
MVLLAARVRARGAALALGQIECQAYASPRACPAPSGVRASVPRMPERPAGRPPARPLPRTGTPAATTGRPGDRYGADVLAGGRAAWATPPRGRSTDLAAERGVVVEDVDTGWVGAVVRVEKAGGVHVVHLEDRRGRTRAFPLGPGFLLDGRPVRLVPPRPAAPARPAAGGVAPGRTASGSVAVAGHRARVARGSRIWVEGRHDAELVEKVWGDDLRVEGVVVQPLDGVDDLSGALEDFAPGPGRRVGVLVDHLVPGTKEQRLVDAALADRRWRGLVHVVGHPYVDVWQAVRPQRLGLERWPVIPRGTSWKHGVLAHLGWAHEDQRDVAHGWKRILGTVRTIADLEPTLSGRVEELIDFVTEPGT